MSTIASKTKKHVQHLWINDACFVFLSYFFLSALEVQHGTDLKMMAQSTPSALLCHQTRRLPLGNLPSEWRLKKAGKINERWGNEWCQAWMIPYRVYLNEEWDYLGFPTFFETADAYWWWSPLETHSRHRIFDKFWGMAWHFLIPNWRLHQSIHVFFSISWWYPMTFSLPHFWTSHENWQVSSEKYPISAIDEETQSCSQWNPHLLMENETIFHLIA